MRACCCAATRASSPTVGCMCAPFSSRRPTRSWGRRWRRHRRLLPSVVSFHPTGTVLVGDAARERRLIDPENTIFSVKPLLGRAWDAPEAVAHDPNKAVHCRQSAQEPGTRLEPKPPIRCANALGERPIAPAAVTGWSRPGPHRTMDTGRGETDPHLGDKYASRPRSRLMHLPPHGSDFGHGPLGPGKL